MKTKIYLCHISVIYIAIILLFSNLTVESYGNLLKNNEDPTLKEVILVLKVLAGYELKSTEYARVLEKEDMNHDSRISLDDALIILDKIYDTSFKDKKEDCIVGDKELDLPENLTTGVLVNFAASEEESVFPFNDWNQIIRNNTCTEFVSSDNDIEHDGITDTEANLKSRAAYFGIKGKTPIYFQKGHKIVATFYNKTHYRLKLWARISFKDENGPEDADWSTAWNTMYPESIDPRKDDEIEPYSIGKLIYYISDETTVLGPNAKPTQGYHHLVVISTICSPAESPCKGAIILTKIELTNKADFNPPIPPKNLKAEMVMESIEAGKTVVELSWDASEDPYGKNNAQTGVNRYVIYRNCQLLDMVLTDAIKKQGEHLVYKDLMVAPNTNYTYHVTALDAAPTGTYSVPGIDRKLGNESKPSKVEITTPSFSSNNLVNPNINLEFLGGFRLPPDEEYQGQSSTWNYASQGLASYPNGNKNHDPEKEFPGSLYAVGHTHYPQIAEVSIPIPSLSKNLNELPYAKMLQPFSNDIWPKVYNGSWRPNGSEMVYMGIGYHPGGKSIGERLYYGIYREYTSTSGNVNGSLSLDLAPEKSIGAWFLRDIRESPDSNNYVDPALIDKFIFAIPQDWANLYTGGRSLIFGQGFQSGVGIPTHGPAIYATCPWESGILPGNEEVISAVELLRYGNDDNMDKWMTNWSGSLAFTGGAWLKKGHTSGVVFCVSRPIGDIWYGGEDGSGTWSTDFDIPATRIAQMRRWHATKRGVSLFFYNPEDLARVVKGELKSWDHSHILHLIFMIY